jgi:hypothetical protein
MRKSHGVTLRTLGIAFEKAVLANDSAFAQELSSALNSQSDAVARK